MLWPELAYVHSIVNFPTRFFTVLRKALRVYIIAPARLLFASY